MKGSDSRRFSAPSDEDDHRLARLAQSLPESSGEREERVRRTAAALLTSGLDPEHLVHRFAIQFGAPDEIAPVSRLKWDLSQVRAGILTARLRITSGTDFDELDRSGWIGPADRSLRQYLRDDRLHAKYSDRAATVRTLAVHYLSRRGGGVRQTLRQAADVYEAWGLEAEANWDPERHKVLMRGLRDDFGLAA